MQRLPYFAISKLTHMKKIVLFTVLCALFTTMGFSQTESVWTPHSGARTSIVADKAVARLAYPKEFKLFDLNIEPLREKLFSVVNRTGRQSAIISLPNADGEIENFEVVEASNFEPALQQRFPEIRAFSGKGITDRAARLKISISPQGIQTMLFRTDRANEFIEAYSADHSIYAVYKSQRQPGQLPWTCSTQDHQMFDGIKKNGLDVSNSTTSSAGELKTMRLAQSCNGEYSNYFGAFNASQVGLVLAAFNATLTRCNGVYENDLGLHLNLIPNTVDVIFYDANTDPYTNLNSWNGQLQTTLTNIIGNAGYDIGHMFGASGGGGNAGCIGCVCVDGVKGRGITSPADGIPQGDNFDIDFVVHEVGHQLGGNHTFSMSNEGYGVNVEVGSGITIMGYAGITSQDVAPHSIDIYHAATIQQIQTNLAGKTCPVTTNISATNATPIVAPVGNFTIPISTPFALTGVATDANAGDVLTYCWEQMDDGAGFTGNSSNASVTKLGGPNWLTFPATTSPTRIFPKLATILAGGYTTNALPGGAAFMRSEALSSVGRTLNFRLTVRDNSVYSSTPPLKVGQTAFVNAQVVVSSTSGPFAVTIPNTNVTWYSGSMQTVTWDVNNTTAAPVSCANVRILLSTDGGQTFPYVLSNSTANDGSESVPLPGVLSTTARIKVEAVGNIFFDISNTNFTIVVPPVGYSFNSTTPATVACAGPATASVSLGTTATGGFSTPIILTATAGVPAGTTVSFAPTPLTPGNATTVTLNNAQTLAAGTYNITVTGTAGTMVQTATVTFTVSAGTAPTVAATASVAACVGNDALFTSSVSGPAATGYQWQVSTNGGTSFTNIPGATNATYTAAGVTTTLNGNLYRVIVTGQCANATSTAGTLTVQSSPSLTTAPANAVECVGNNAVFTVVATGTGLNYQWQVSTNGGSTFTDIPGALSATYTATAVTLGMNNNQYRVVISGTCPLPITSPAATLSVGNAASITTPPASTTVCVGATANFNVVATGSSLTYQWQLSTDGGTTWSDVTGATSAALSLPSVVATQNGHQYRVNVFSCTPTPITSSAVTLTVNTLVAVNTQPAAVVLCEGSNASFSVAAVGTGAAYQWQVSTTGCAGTFTNISGATSNTLTVSNTTASQNGYAYRVVITGACNTVTSGCAALTVNSPIVVTTQPASTSACLPTQTSASFSVAVTGTAPTYQWQVSTNAGTTWTNVTGATSASLTVTGLTAAMTGNQYRAVLNGTCTSNLNSAAATLTVNTLVNITGQPTAKAICAGASTVFTVAATGSTITYQWQLSINGNPFVNITNGGNYAGATTAALSVNNASVTMNGYVYRVIVSGVPCGSVTSTSATLTVNALPSAVLVAAENDMLTPYLNSGLYVTVSPVATYTYQYFKNGFPVSGASSASLPVNVDGFGEYTAIATNTVTGCSSVTNKVSVSEKASDMVFVYPNPNKGQFQVRYYASATTAYSVVVFDSKGTLVFKKQYTINTPYSRMDVNLKNASSGVYMLEVRDSKGKRLASSSVVVTR